MGDNLFLSGYKINYIIVVPIARSLVSRARVQQFNHKLFTFIACVNHKQPLTKGKSKIVLYPETVCLFQDKEQSNIFY